MLLKYYKELLENDFKKSEKNRSTKKCFTINNIAVLILILFSMLFHRFLLNTARMKKNSKSNTIKQIPSL